MSLFGRRSARPAKAARPAPADLLVIGLGNPGDQFAGTRHNLGFAVAAELSRRWRLPKPRLRYGGLIAEGKLRHGGPRVVLLTPQTYMNESGSVAGPARGDLGLGLDRVIVLHDEIDLPFGQIQARHGGGMAGHKGLKSMREGLGGADFWRVRAGVGRPDSTDPDVVSAWVLGPFRENRDEVADLVSAAADRAEKLIEELAAE